MDALSKIPGWATGRQELQQRGAQVLEVVRGHPWMSLGAAAGTVLVWNYVTAPRNLPPGPRGYPVVGMRASTLTANFPKQYTEWRKQYGDVYSFYRHGKLYVILNGERTIREAYITNSDQFSHMYMGIFNAIGIDDEIFTGRFCDSWKADKRFALSSLKNAGSGTTKSEGRIHKLFTDTMDAIQDAGQTPVDIFPHLGLISAATMSRIVLGDSMTDAETKELLRITDHWYAAFNLAFFVASPFSPSNILIPNSLRSLFPAKASLEFTKLHRELKGFLSKKIKSITPSKDPGCVATAYLKARGSSDEAIENFVKTMWIFFPDALDTACIITWWSILFVTYYPEVQQRFYDEMKSTIGANGLPTFNDRLKMPFTQAIMSETLRLTHITPLSTVRELQSEVKINGYTLPKGANVIANYHGIHYDPEIFPEPYKFNPLRFIDADGKFNSALADRSVPFSMGPRRCLGESFVRVYLFLAITRLIQRFHLSFDPAAPTPSLKSDPLFFFPKPQKFKVCFKSR